ncbi:hypothetical protein QBC36DRAFT_350371 [Triangularia setosa]|uniref:Uncharacterized protein n=1 Tax=Triangularia setosa TaxID=2587417 RepID=A0AAN6W0D8_9PEZI|nr:hypothetical protein QBC36DRAFT_350371 [Podospora setosa]
MQLNIFVSLLASLIFPWTAAAQDFSGRGQIRALYTSIESHCGEFNARRVGSNNEFRLSSTGAGSCEIEGVSFKCGIPGGIFGVRPVGGREVIRYSAYDIMAIDIHFSTGKEGGKAVWLGWKGF